MYNPPEGRDPLTDLLRDPRVRSLLLAFIPAVFGTILAYAGGVRDLNDLLGLGIAVYLIFGITFLALPKGESTGLRYYQTQVSSPEELQKKVGRLGMDLFKRPTPETIVLWFNPQIEEDALLACLVYLSSNRYIIDEGFRSMLTESQERSLHDYMLAKGFAYDSDDVYEGGWAITAAGRAIINRYLTHVLIHAE